MYYYDATQICFAQQMFYLLLCKLFLCFAAVVFSVRSMLWSCLLDVQKIPAKSDFIMLITVSVFSLAAGRTSQYNQGCYTNYFQNSITK